MTTLPEQKTHVWSCQWCGGPLVRPLRGRSRRYCRASCRQRAYEKRKADRVAAAVGQWLDWTRQELAIAQDDLQRLDQVLHPAEIPVRPRRRRAAPRFACPPYGRFAGYRIDTITEWNARPLLGPPPPPKTVVFDAPGVDEPAADDSAAGDTAAGDSAAGDTAAGDSAAGTDPSSQTG